MKYIVLASGTKGNSTLIISSLGTKMLIDVGLSINEIKTKIEKQNLNIEEIDKILITHEHGDHNKSLDFFEENKVLSFLNKKIESFKSFFINDLKITPLPLSHYVVCFGFLFVEGKQKLVYITNNGYINNNLKKYLKNADIYIFESNHDVKMLINSTRPTYLKDRILSDSGHLSNNMASEELCEFIGNNTKEIVFAHISRDVNTKEKVLETFLKVSKENKINIKNIKIVLSDQYEEVMGGL